MGLVSVSVSPHARIFSKHSSRRGSWQSEASAYIYTDATAHRPHDAVHHVMSQARGRTAPKGSLTHADALVDAVRAGSLAQLTGLLTGVSVDDINRCAGARPAKIHLGVWGELLLQLLLLLLPERTGV